MTGQKSIIGLACRFGLQISSQNVKNIVKMIKNAKGRRSALCVGDVTIGENEFPPWQSADGGAQLRVGLDPGIIDIMDLFEELIGVDTVQVDQPVHRCSIVAIIGLLDRARLIVRKLQKIGHIGGHLFVDL